MKGNALQILLVEDNAGDAPVLRQKFSTDERGSFVDAAKEITLSFDLSLHSKSHEHETERE
jgi:hypothetical protein